MLDRLAQTPSGKLMDEKGNAEARKRRDEVLQHLDQSPRFTKQGRVAEGEASQATKNSGGEHRETRVDDCGRE